MASYTGPARGFVFRAALKRLGLGVLVSAISVVLLLIAQIPGELARASGTAAGMTVAFAGTFPRGTPNHRLKNTLLWGAHFVLFTGGMLLIARWRGA